MDDENPKKLSVRLAPRGLAVLVAPLVLLVAACSSTGPEISDKGAEAYTALHQSDYLMQTSVGFAGGPPSELYHFRTLLAEPEADYFFKSLIRSSDTAGKFYGLAGVYHTDPALFRESLETLALDDTTVGTMAGCVMGKAKISEIVDAQFRNFRFPKNYHRAALRLSEEYPNR